MTHTVPITRAGDTQPVRPDGVVIIDRDTGLPAPTLAQGRWCGGGLTCSV